MLMLRRVMVGGQREGARRPFVAGDQHVECFCMKEVYGPHCWCGMDGDLRQAMWLDTLTEFKCTASSTWLICDDLRENGSTHKA